MEKTVKENEVKEALGKVMNEASNNYIGGKNKIATSSIVIGDKWERWLFAIWPGNSTLELHYACDGLPIIDIGDLICAFNREYFTVDQIVDLTMKLINETFAGL